MFQYYLVHGSNRILLFESQFDFSTEESSLRYFERGLAKGLFTFDRARIDQVWSELGLWGLIGRICPVELVRVLCAFGCELQMTDQCCRHRRQRKSFRPVTYFVSVPEEFHSSLRYMYSWPVEGEPDEYISVLLELADRIVLGSFYVGYNETFDSQFPIFCDLLEQDLCLPRDIVRSSLFNLFWAGHHILAQGERSEVALATRNCSADSIRGVGNEETLFYLSTNRECGRKLA